MNQRPFTTLPGIARTLLVLVALLSTASVSRADCGNDAPSSAPPPEAPCRDFCVGPSCNAPPDMTAPWSTPVPSHQALSFRIDFALEVDVVLPPGSRLRALDVQSAGFDTVLTLEAVAPVVGEPVWVMVYTLAPGVEASLPLGTIRPDVRETWQIERRAATSPVGAEVTSIVVRRGNKTYESAPLLVNPLATNVRQSAWTLMGNPSGRIWHWQAAL